MLFRDHPGDRFHSWDVRKQVARHRRMGVKPCLFLGRKFLACINRFHHIRRQRDAPQLGHHGSHFETPWRFQLPLFCDVLDITANSGGTAECGGIDQAEHLYQHLNASAQGFFQQFLFGRDETILHQSGGHRLGQGFLGTRLG